MSENKENVYLLSPLQTPSKIRKHKKISTNPLYVLNDSTSTNKISKESSRLSELYSISVDFSENDESLQLLNDSVFYKDELANSFSSACRLSLPKSPDNLDSINYQNDTNSEKNKLNENLLLIESFYLAEICKFDPADVEELDLQNCTPPWKDDESDNEDKFVNEVPTQEKKEVSPIVKILNNSETVVDKKQSVENSNKNEPLNKLQKSKSDSKLWYKSKNIVKEENKGAIPKIKAQPTALKKEKILKVKTEKEKVLTKGPMKALIPLTNMAKNKKSIVPNLNVPSTTPPKQSQMKRISTPNEYKMKSPIAQSTPDVSKKTTPNKETKIRRFGFPVTPISRPKSQNNISNENSNSLLSTSNLNKSGSNLRLSSNTSIPTLQSIGRRNSASEMSTSKSSLNRSYENNNKPTRPVPLKRSSSFQNKSSTSTETVSSNLNLKKFGLPGKIKPLKLVKK